MQRRTDIPTLSSLEELDEARSTTDPAPPLTPLQPAPIRDFGATLPISSPTETGQVAKSSAPPTLRESDAPAPQPVRAADHGLMPHSRKRTLDATPVAQFASAPAPAERRTDSLGHTLQSGATTPSAPELTVAAPAAAPLPQVLPPTAPLWMRRARELSLALEAAISAGLGAEEDPAPSAVSGVDRAYEAWAAGGFDAAEIASVSESVRTTYRAILRPTHDPASAVAAQAHTLFKQLPARVGRWVSPTFLAQMVSDLRSQTSERDAVVRGTMRILGWDVTGERAAERTIEAARTEADAKAKG